MNNEYDIQVNFEESGQVKLTISLMNGRGFAITQKTEHCKPAQIGEFIQAIVDLMQLESEEEE